MDKIIQKFIIWYLKRHNVKFDRDGYVVRMFSAEYYSRLMAHAKLMDGINCRCSVYPVFNAEKMTIDEKIEYWHTHETGNSLREFLGMTEEQYLEFALGKNITDTKTTS